MARRPGVSILRGIGVKITVPILVVIFMFSFPALLAWNGMQDIQRRQESMNDYARSLTIIHQLQASFEAELEEGAGTDESGSEFISRQLQRATQRANRINVLQKNIDYEPESSWLFELKALNDRSLALLGNAGQSVVDETDSPLYADLAVIKASMNDLYMNLSESVDMRSNNSALASYDDAQQSARSVLYTMLGACILGVGMTLLFSRRIVRPVRELASAARDFSAGKLSRRVDIAGEDELSGLGAAFNNMASSLQLRTDALIREQSKLRSVHQSITDGILVYGNNGFIVSANPAAETILGKNEAKLAGSRKTGIAELDRILSREQLKDPEDMVRCWEYLDCNHDACPSHRSSDLRCWLQCGDFCHDDEIGRTSLKSDICERCPVYRINGCASLDAEIDGRSYSITVAPILNERAETDGRLAVMHDMTKEYYHAKQLGLLYEIVNTIASSSSVMDSMQESLELCISATDASSGSIMLLDEDESLVIAAQKGLPDILKGHRQLLGEGIAGWVARSGEPLLLTEDEPDSRFPGARNLRDAVCLPIRDENGVVGVLSLNERRTAGGFTRESLDFLGPVAVQMGTALSRARLHEKIVEEKEKSTAIVDCMGESLCVRTPDRKIVFANSAHKDIFGEESVGQPCHNVYVGRDHICRGCPLDRCFEAGATVRRSHFVLDKLGNRRQLETTASPIRDADGKIVSCIEVSRDVTEMLQIRDQAESRLQTLTTLFQVSNTLSSSLDLGNILDNFMDSAREAMHASCVAVYLFNEGTDRLAVRAIKGETGHWSIRAGDIVDLEPFGLNELASGVGPFCAGSPGQISEASALLAPPGSQSVLVGRLSSRGRLLGLVSISSIKKNAFSQPGQMDLFVDITNQASVAIDNAEMYEKLEETFWCTIRSLAEAIDAKDAYTRGHSDRVADYAEALGRRVLLDEKDLNAVRCAGYLHDTGKIGIPDAILLKPGRLTESEYAEIMRHPILSHRIIEPVEFPYDVKPIVRHHHERIDGSGYPDGLMGDEIPLGARIVGIADAFEAMTSDRPYRKALSFKAAAQELRRCAGTQFDEELVNEFLDFLEEKPLRASA